LALAEPRLTGFERALQRAARIDAAQWQQKRNIGWGSDCAISGFRQTEDAAINRQKTGILYMKGAYPEGHDHKRRGFIERTIVLETDRRFATKMEQAEFEWLFGRKCKECGRQFPITPQHFYRDAKSLCGFRHKCKQCESRYHRDYHLGQKRKQYSTKIVHY